MRQIEAVLNELKHAEKERVKWENRVKTLEKERKSVIKHLTNVDVV